MKTIVLDVTHIQTKKALHIYLQYMLDLPAHYGRNLDALHDVLAEESEALRIVLCGAQHAQGELTAYMPALLEVLEDAAQENEKLSFEVK